MKLRKLKWIGALALCLGLMGNAAFAEETPETTLQSEMTEEVKSEKTDDVKEKDEKLSALMKDLEGQLAKLQGNWSVYVCDLKTGSEDSVSNHKMQAASLVKLYIMGAVYENYEELSEIYGSETLENKLYPMITVSDNDAANYLTECLGKGNPDEGMKIVTEFCKKHGFEDSEMGRLLLHSNEFGDNYTSVVDTGHFMKEIYDCRAGKEEKELTHTKEMFSLLSKQQRRHKIPSRLPESVKVANKTGELSNVENDAGILYDSQSGQDLVIVFMSDSLPDVGVAQSAIGSMSRYIFDYYNKGGAVG